MSIEFKTRVESEIASIKKKSYNWENGQGIQLLNDRNEIVAILKPITKDTIRSKRVIDLLAKWRAENSFAFPSQFKVTIAGTKRWTEALLKNPTRLLFFISSGKNINSLIGHIGLSGFDFKDDTCEIDNVVRGNKKVLKGAMTLALRALIDWTTEVLQPKNIYLRVFSDNQHAVSFYQRNNFKVVKKIALKKTVKPGLIIWEEVKTSKKAAKFFLLMRHFPV